MIVGILIDLAMKKIHFILQSIVLHQRNSYTNVKIRYYVILTSLLLNYFDISGEKDIPM